MDKKCCSLETGWRASNPRLPSLRSIALSLLSYIRSRFHFWSDNPQRAAHRNWSGSRDSHPDRLLHRERCCCYTTILESDEGRVSSEMTLAANDQSLVTRHPSLSVKWGPRSDSHRRIRVYETRPVAAEAQGRFKWCSHVDSHHEPPPSQSGVQKLLTP